MDEIQDLILTIREKAYTHLIFDMDETLTRLKLPWDEGLENLASKSLTHLHQPVAKRKNESYSHIVNSTVDQDESFLPIAIFWAKEFESQLTDHDPHFDLIARLPELSKEHRLIIWTSNVRATADKVLGELELRDLFSQIVAREDVRYLKPNPDGWKHINDGTPISQYLFIGDSCNDSGVAEALGIDFFEITHFHKR